MLLGHSLPQKGNCEIMLNYFLLLEMFWVPYTFQNLYYNHDEKRLFGNRTFKARELF
jgi:hypothetical protein